MSQEELQRVEVLARVRSNQLRVVDASRLLGVSYRQAKRLWKRYREEGPASLKHRSAGCTSNHAYAPKFRQRVLDLVRKKYGGPVGERFGPTLAAEHLEAEDGLLVNAETLRLWMLEAGAFTRGRTDHAVWRHVCEAGDRGDRSEFAGSQGTNRADARHASRSAGEETAAEADPQSRSGECVPAEGISARTQPAVRPCGGQAGRLPSGAPRAAELDRIFRLENERTIGNDWVVRYANHYFQLEPQSRHYAPARSKVLVCEGRHGGISIEYRGRALGWKQIAAPPAPRAEAVGARVAVAIAKRKWVPPADHPWREAARRAVQQKALREVARAPLARPCASP